ncbi:hypothetical protein THOG05_230084 [Vibrio rotiferianus]|uniref:Uncharacterized protein n=1 Tax=Vibrio rotiferianus TaxID=190895 RepID=A0A510IGC2_9VIBR|nr:hypothetical protein VroAM7_39530 [Vibrio rotiferianus]CAH1537846.1 hypothetical protein THOG05_230084 [Vibrio rotiferianus]CAH1575134.1 hypothetical protein THOE12_50025 [Vibrio rotiferianus]CAH1587354.1 hypothetical protein THOG10_40202 [Vibrio rotiferianus]CAH1589288.1 hypothetical protein THOB06_40201 [Vibrio rotiferianus]
MRAETTWRQSSSNTDNNLIFKGEEESSPLVVFGKQKYNSYESNEIKYRSVDLIGFDSRSRGKS